MQSINQSKVEKSPYSLREVTEVLIKHQGLHEGSYNLSFEFQIAVGAVSPSPNVKHPGVIMGISGIGLQLAKEKNDESVDAAEVNPKVVRNGN